MLNAAWPIQMIHGSSRRLAVYLHLSSHVKYLKAFKISKWIHPLSTSSQKARFRTTRRLMRFLEASIFQWSVPQLRRDRESLTTLQIMADHDRSNPIAMLIIEGPYAGKDYRANSTAYIKENEEAICLLQATGITSGWKILPKLSLRNSCTFAEWPHYGRMALYL